MSRFRNYFFFRNPKEGQLFLHDAKVKNFITAFKDPVFLNFFYSRIRPVQGKTDRYEKFRWVSPCGPETNFIEVDSVPIIWQYMAKNKNDVYELEDSSKTFKIPFQAHY